MNPATLQLPTQHQLDVAASAFDRDWGGVDEVLYGVCQEHPDHNSIRAVTAKVALVDRAYSAGFERRVTPPKGQQAITVIADFVLAHGAEIDRIMARLVPLNEPLSVDLMTEVVRGHGELTTLLQEVATDGKAPRSFAAKYLHFHCPVVPIYDGYAAAGLVRCAPWRACETRLPRVPLADVEYGDFCVRFLCLYEACRQADLVVTVKSLDAYLWQVPRAS